MNIWILQDAHFVPQNELSQDWFPSPPASHSVCQSSSSSWLWKCLDSSFNPLPFFFFCMWLPWQSGCGVVMAANWMAWLCAGEKDSLSGWKAMRLRASPLNSWGHPPHLTAWAFHTSLRSWEQPGVLYLHTRVPFSTCSQTKSSDSSYIYLKISRYITFRGNVNQWFLFFCFFISTNSCFYTIKFKVVIPYVWKGAVLIIFWGLIPSWI